MLLCRAALSCSLGPSPYRGPARRLDGAGWRGNRSIHHDRIQFHVSRESMGSPPRPSFRHPQTRLAGPELPQAHSLSSDTQSVAQALDPSLPPLLPPTPDMSLVSGPGRAATSHMPAEMHLFVDKHVRYIQSLDTVRTSCSCLAAQAPALAIPR